MLRAPGGLMRVSIHFVGSETLLLDSFKGFVFIKLPPDLPECDTTTRQSMKSQGKPKSSNPGSPHHAIGLLLPECWSCCHRVNLWGLRIVPVRFVGPETLLLEGFRNFIFVKLLQKLSRVHDESDHTINNNSGNFARI